LAICASYFLNYEKKPVDNMRLKVMDYNKFISPCCFLSLALFSFSVFWDRLLLSSDVATTPALAMPKMSPHKLPFFG
jgi:hypothetical protein